MQQYRPTRFAIATDEDLLVLHMQQFMPESVAFTTTALPESVALATPSPPKVLRMQQYRLKTVVNATV